MTSTSGKRSVLRTWLLLAWLLATAALAWTGLRAGWVQVPERWNPWAPLHFDETPNLLTQYKLARAAGDPALCRATLAQARLRYTPIEDQRTAPGCGFDNAIRIARSSVAVGEPFALSCRAALSLAMWERHVLQQAATAYLGQEVAAIEHFGSYSCRNLYGREGARRSRHATADALDIAGFVLADGKRIRLVNDWKPADPAPPAGREAGHRDGSRGDDVRSSTTGGGSGAGPATPDPAGFLREVRDGACRYFDVVLGPDYNQAHADHFHLDRGGGRACR